jgi:hypothetical protein
MVLWAEDQGAVKDLMLFQLANLRGQRVIRAHYEATPRREVLTMSDLVK